MGIEHTAPSRCTIGIPAHNEERSISSALASLMCQELPDSTILDILVVANGCGDHTIDEILRTAHKSFGQPRSGENDEGRWWRFDGASRTLTAYETPIASKSRAINLIHKLSVSDVIFLFDADTDVPRNVVRSMWDGLAAHPECCTVAPAVTGIVDPDTSQLRIAQFACRAIGNSINEFDRRQPRLDGRGYGYRRVLVREHASIVAVDMWLEGVAATRGAGCLYLNQTFLYYRLPRTLGELVEQYVRYAVTQRELARAFPGMPAAILTMRSQVEWASKPALWSRIVGGVFLAVTALIASRRKNLADGPWRTASSTKG